MHTEIFVVEYNPEKGKIPSTVKKAIIILFTKRNSNLSKLYLTQNLIEIYTKTHQIAQFFRGEHAPQKFANRAVIILLFY